MKSSTAFEKSQLCQDDHNVATWGWSKTASFFISRCFATKRYVDGTSDSFPHFIHPMTSQLAHPLCLKKCQTHLDSFWGSYMTNNVFSFLQAHSKMVMVINLLKLLMCYSNNSCSYYMKVVFISFSASRGAATIWGQLQIKGGVNLWNTVHLITIQFIVFCLEK